MTTMRMNSAMMASLLLATLATGVDARAQEAQEASEPMKIGCLAGRRMPQCKSFWIVEVQGATPIAQTTRTVTQGTGRTYPMESFETEVAWNLGHMVNLSPDWAVGGLFTVGTGGESPLTGIRLRARRWLVKELSVELEGGVLRSNAGGYRYPGVTGLTADVRLNINDHGSFFVRWDGVDIPPEETPGEWGRTDPGGWQNGFLVGASLGSKPAIAATGALMVAYGVVIAILIRAD